MLEFLRRQTKPIMITVAVIIIIAFTFWGDPTGSSPGRGGVPEDHPMLTVLGRDYTMADVIRLQRDFRIAGELRLPGVMDYFANDVVQLKMLYGDTPRSTAPPP